MGRVVVAALVLVIVVMMSTVAVQSALEDSGEDTLVDNESFVPDTNYTNLANSNQNGTFYNETVRVWDENTTEMTAGDDYEWNARNGTVRAVSGGNLEGDTEANITYGFVEVSEEAQQMETMLSQIPALIGPWLIFAIIIIMGAFMFQ